MYIYINVKIFITFSSKRIFKIKSVLKQKNNNNKVSVDERFEKYTIVVHALTLFLCFLSLYMRCHEVGCRNNFHTILHYTDVININIVEK